MTTISCGGSSAGDQGPQVQTESGAPQSYPDQRQRAHNTTARPPHVLAPQREATHCPDPPARPRCGTDTSPPDCRPPILSCRTHNRGVRRSMPLPSSALNSACMWQTKIKSVKNSLSYNIYISYDHMRKSIHLAAAHRWQHIDVFYPQLCVARWKPSYSLWVQNWLKEGSRQIFCFSVDEGNLNFQMVLFTW